MAMSGSGLLLAAYLGVLFLLSIFGLHRLYLVSLYLRTRRAAPIEPPPPERWPMVTVQLPVFNEMYVVERLIDAVARLDYPSDRLEVQVLDDSTDATSESIWQQVALLRRSGLNITHLRRSNRSGFKAGALRAGMYQARGELLCIFDADFVPTPEFLQRTVPHFTDPTVGMVQVRWSHLNRDHSQLTRIQAMFLDAHFAIEHAARNRAGRFFNFNGTAGVWRRAAIEAAGGWEHDTLTEDLDLSYRAQLAGWRFVYLNELRAPSELPVSIAAFKSQQRRWTKGAVQTARKLLSAIWTAPHPWATKVEASFHFASNLAYVLLVALSLLVFPTMLVRAPHGNSELLLLALPILLFGTGSVGVFFVLAQHQIGRSVVGAVIQLPALMALGIGLALNNTIAVAEGLLRAPGEFVRTPKLTTATCGDVSYRSALGILPIIETLMTLYFAAATGLAVALQIWICLPVLLLFLSGYGWVAWMSLTELAARSMLRPMAYGSH